MSDEPDAVLYEVIDGVALVTLNRPDRLNASNGALSRGLTAAMTRAAGDEAVRVVLLVGAGRGFCAGADMQVLGELSGDASAPNSGSGGLRYDGLRAMPKPVIGAVHGACAGVGLDMACSADIRIAAESAFFVAPFARLGLCAEGGLAWLLPRLIGAGNAAEMLMTGRRVGAQEAYAKGLVAHVLPDEGFAAAALDFARDMARHCAPASLEQIKRQLRESPDQSYAEARELAVSLTKDILRGSDFREGIAAKGERRPPRFSGMSGTFDPPVGNNDRA